MGFSSKSRSGLRRQGTLLGTADDRAVACDRRRWGHRDDTRGLGPGGECVEDGTAQIGGREPAPHGVGGIDIHSEPDRLSGESRNLGQAFTITRIGNDFVFHIGMNYDSSKNNVGFTFSIEPKFGPFYSGVPQFGMLPGNIQGVNQ